MGGPIKVAGAGLLLNLALLTCASSSRADGPADRASSAYQAAEDSFHAGDFRAAALSFETANRLDPHGATSYNAALAWDAAADAARAADDYAAALQAPDLPASFEKQAHVRLAALELSLAQVALSAAAGARVSLAHVHSAEAPLRVHVPPGTYEVRCTMQDGLTASRTIAVAAGTSMTVDFSASAPAATPPVAPHPATPPSDRAPPDASTSGSSKTLAWVAVGSAAALGVTSTVLYLVAEGARNTFVDGGLHDVGLHDQAEQNLVECWVAGGLAIAALGTGIVLLLTSDSPHRDGARGPQLRLGLRSVEIEGTF